MRVAPVEGRRRPFGLRGWLIVAAVVLVILLLSLRGLARFYTDYLWFKDVGFQHTWRSLLSAKAVPALIFSVDRDHAALARQQTARGRRFAQAPTSVVLGDFREPLELPPLDGVVMANSLHFTDDKAPVLVALKVAEAFHARDGRLPLNVRFLSRGRGGDRQPQPAGIPRCAPRRARRRLRRLGRRRHVAVRASRRSRSLRRDCSRSTSP